MGGGLVCHLFVTWLLCGMILDQPEIVNHPYPLALPIFMIGVYWGWKAVYLEERRERQTKRKIDAEV